MEKTTDKIKNITTEQQYLEMSQHFKEVIDSKDKELNHYQDETKELKKEMIAVYGMFRLLDNVTDGDPYEGDFEFKLIVETIRRYLSDIIEKFFNDFRPIVNF